MENRIVREVENQNITEVENQIVRETEISSLEKFKRYMADVMNKKILSPFQSYEDFGYPNNENENINFKYLIRRGFCVISFQNGKKNEDDIGDGRSHIAFLMEMKRENFEFIYSLAEEFNVTWNRYGRNGYNSKTWPLCPLTRSLTEVNCDSYCDGTVPDGESLGRLEHITRKMRNKIIEKMIYIEVTDLVWCRSIDYMLEKFK